MHGETIVTTCYEWDPLSFVIIFASPTPKALGGWVKNVAKTDTDLLTITGLKPGAIHILLLRSNTKF